MAANDDEILLQLRLATEQFIASLAKVETESRNTMKGMAADTEKAGQTGAAAFARAFKTLDVRPVQEIRAEVKKLEAAYADLKNGGASVEDLRRAKVALREQTASLNAEMGKGTGIMGGLQNAFGGLRGALAALGIGAIGDRFLEANLAAEKLQKGLLAVTGDAGTAARDMQFLKDTANKLGLDLNTAATSFVKLAAASKGTALEGDATKQIYEQIGGALSQLGISGADAERAFNALGQMMSKGTVMSEELKGQLGDVLPGAVQIAARSIGLTTAELQKLMQDGGVVADEFLPRFAAEVSKTFGTENIQKVEGLRATINRLGNQWQEMFAAMGDGGATEILSAGLAGINAVLTVVASTVGVVITGLVGLGKSIGVLMGAVATMDFSRVGEELAAIGGEMNASIERYAKLSNASLGLEDSTKKVGAATAQAGQQAAAAAPGWERVNIAYSTAVSAAEAYTAAAIKTAEANNAAAAASVKVAELSGNEVAALNARAQAAQVAADGAKAVTAAQQIELQTLQAKLIAQQDAVKGQAELNAAQNEAIKKSQEAIAAKTVEIEKSTAAADAARTEAVAQKLKADTYGDQSAQLTNLAAALTTAQLAVAQLEEKQKAGAATDAQVTAAREVAAIATVRYKDAVADATAAVDQNLKISQSQLGVQMRGLDVQLASARAAMDIARATGNEAEARRLNGVILEIEIRKKELAARMSQLEAAAAWEKVRLLQAEAEATGTLTAEKAREIEMARLAAQSKSLDAEVAGIAAEGMRDLARATSEYAKQAGKASGVTDGSLTPSLDRLGGAANSAAERTRAQSDKAAEGGKMSFSTSVEQMLAARGITLNAEQLQAVKANWEMGFAKAQAAMAGRRWTAGLNEEMTGNAIANAIDLANEGNAKIGLVTDDIRRNSYDPFGPPNASNYRTPQVRKTEDVPTIGSPTSKQTSARQVNITLQGPGGSPVNLYADDEAAATQLIEILRRAGLRTGG